MCCSRFNTIYRSFLPTIHVHKKTLSVFRQKGVVKEVISTMTRGQLCLTCATDTSSAQK